MLSRPANRVPLPDTAYEPHPLVGRHRLDESACERPTDVLTGGVLELSWEFSGEFPTGEPAPHPWFHPNREP